MKCIINILYTQFVCVGLTAQIKHVRSQWDINLHVIVAQYKTREKHKVTTGITSATREHYLSCFVNCQTDDDTLI